MCTQYVTMAHTHMQNKVNKHSFIIHTCTQIWIERHEKTRRRVKMLAQQRTWETRRSLIVLKTVNDKRHYCRTRIHRHRSAHVRLFAQLTCLLCVMPMMRAISDTFMAGLASALLSHLSLLLLLFVNHILCVQSGLGEVRNTYRKF